MRPHRSLFAISSTAIALALALSACGDDGGPSGTGVGGDGGAGASTTGTHTGGSTTANGGSTSAGGMGPACDAPSPEHPGLVLNVGQVTASITDQNGDPAAAVPGDLCGINICAVYGESDENGDYDEDAGGEEIYDPALLYGDGKGYAKMAAPLEMASVQFGAIDIIKLPPFAEGAELLGGSDAISGEVVLSLPMGASVFVDPIVYQEESERVFRAAVVEASAMNLPAVDDSLGLELLIAMAPIDAVVCPGAILTFPNTMGWEEGAKIDLYLHGSAIFNHYAPYGQWEKITTATVTAEGVVSDEGIEFLGVYGAVPQ